MIELDVLTRLVWIVWGYSLMTLGSHLFVFGEPRD